ncbi:MAG: hypothetical protein HYU67_04635 [Flavobacteriia bacterium]|nr:hypothetical protein [Flavobacteriia bacterium]
MKKWWSGLSSREQLIVGLLIILFLAIFWRKIVRFFQDYIHKPKNADELKKELEENNELIQYQKAGVSRSFSEQTYVHAAEKLFNAMHGAGTDEEGVLKIMTFYVKNDIDFILLYKAFGYRQGALWSSSSDLRSWIKSDLSDYWVGMINNDYKIKGMLKRI